jgi:hypothetical protein
MSAYTHNANTRRPKHGRRLKQKDHLPQMLDPRVEPEGASKEAACHILCRPGGSSEKPEPDPIPNSAVKLLSADGTVSQDPGE